MPPQQGDLWLQVVAGGAFVASVLTWLALGRRFASGVALLPYELRRPVPWGPSGAILAVLMVGLALVSLVHSPPEPDPGSAESLLEAIAQPLVLVLLVAGALLVAARAGRQDIGLPADGRELLRDVKIGVVAWLVAIVPVYGMQAALVTWWGEPSQHPLIKTLIENPDPALLAAAFVSAVLLAPLYEETAFRLMLQGWLEKVAQGNATAITPTNHGDEAACVPTATSPHVGDGDQNAWPIVVSALLFALAHVGHGPDPIPLFFLALILGYVYRQTHRIVPCIVTHALFNLLSLVMLAILLRQAAPAPVP